MINPFKIKKIAALMLCGLLTTIMFFIGMQTGGLLWGIIFMLIGTIISYFVGNSLLKNPFTELIEGKGILMLDITSTGIIQPYICMVQTPYIKARIGRKWIEDIFNRSAVFQWAKPITAKKPAIVNEDKTKFKIEIGEKEYNDGRFALFHYPCLIFNSQIESTMTKDMLMSKDMLADKEKEAAAEHGILYLNKKMQELSNAMRDFGRYVVELTKPGKSLLGNRWMWIIIIIGLGIILIMFAPRIFTAISKGMPGASLAAKSLGGATQTITPIG